MRYPSQRTARANQNLIQPAPIAAPFFMAMKPSLRDGFSLQHQSTSPQHPLFPWPLSTPPRGAYEPISTTPGARARDCIESFRPCNVGPGKWLRVDQRYAQSSASVLFAGHAFVAVCTRSTWSRIALVPLDRHREDSVIRGHGVNIRGHGVNCRSVVCA